MERVNIPEFEDKNELFDFLVKEKKSLIAQKRAITKEADGIRFAIVTKDGSVSKANEPFTPNGDEFKVKVVINTTNLLDSHDDVHIPGLWKKSLAENKMIMHVEAHKRDFEDIIADEKDLVAFTKKFTWDALGFPQYDGNTEALIFDSNITKERNAFMFKQYSKGWVRNHSVGMRYVQLVLCINDDNRGAEFEAWEKYFPIIANKEDAEERGFFWAVKEAKIIEGSAVTLPSNPATPTLDNNAKNEPDNTTQKTINEPSLDDTQREFYLEFNKHKS